MKRNLFKKIGAFLAMVCMLISLLPVTILANPDAGANEASKLDLQIPADAISLSTPEDILALVENCRTNTWSIGKTVVLANDIDMSGVEFTGIPTFGGVFIGQGHVISGIKMDHKGSTVGFFRYLQKTAIVEGLTIKGEYIFEGSHTSIGGFVGNNAGSIYNCTFEGTVAGAQQIGGFAGVNATTGLIENCTVSGTVYGNHFVGGFVGQNDGVVRKCTNFAELNTKSVQNSVDLEDITLDSFINTEDAGTITDIGGIAGGNSGVIRGCVNKGLVGYQKMGYNIGGIVGTQNGFVVDCENYGQVHGRKEVGGIVGHTEPNIVLKYDKDSLQILDGQMDKLNASYDKMEGSIQNNGDEISNQIEGMEGDVNNANDALDTLLDAMNPENGRVDEDKVTAAAGDLGDSLKNLYDQSASIQGKVNDSSQQTADQLGDIIDQMDVMLGTVENADQNINISISDVSRNDTDADTLGKISNCTNYGNVTGDLNIGGIAGVLAEENDLDEYQDTEIIGDVSINATYQLRVVIRDCVNYGTVSASKQYAGGITGQMLLGAVIECINVGNVDAIHADYVGGIAGCSDALIRNSSAKSILSGDSYVGGIAGKGDEVVDCYAFVDMKYFVEKAGAVVGYTDELPDGKEDVILRNYYFNAGKEAGGIDGIAYTGSADKVDVAAFLQLPNLSDILKTVTLRFIVEGQDDVVLTVNVGESLTMDQIPTIQVEADSEYEWELIPAVAYEILSMGETATVEYLSEDSITNILFSQIYQVSFDLKDTVISSTQRNDKNMSIALAEGTFAKNTTLDLTDMPLNGKIVLNGSVISNIVEGRKVTLSNTGVNKLHYLIPEGLNAEDIKLYVQNEAGKWVEREYAVEGSYIVFDFTDGEAGFALQHNEGDTFVYMLVVVVTIILVAVVMSILVKKRMKKAKA